MTNINVTPNHLHLSEGNSTYGAYFGGLVAPIKANLLPHHPHIVAYFKGLRLELEPSTAIEVARGIYEAVAAMGSRAFPDCSGARADLGGDE